MKFSLLILVILLSSVCFAQSVSIIPEPVSAKMIQGKFLSTNQIRFFCDQDQETIIRNFFQELNWLGIKIAEPKKSDRKSANLILEKSKNISGKEAYQLSVSEKAAIIQASTDAGLFYGLQSLVQLAVSENNSSGFHIPCVTIEDQPQFGWRGLMLDESRHFFGKEKVKMLLDWMAFYKLNRFHWHLTDVPGWRLEIMKYPRLTSVGAIGNGHDPEAPAQFYTQADVREIIQYATERHIEIIPEIDMPGHAAAANRAYPEFSGGGSDRYPEFTFNPGKEGTYQFLTDILKEVAQLFPSKYIHLGGDEVHFGNQQWNTNPDVKALMQRFQLKDLTAVEHYFINRMTDTIASLGKTMIGWDEIVTAKIPVGKSVVMWWRHDKPEQMQLALESGYHTILCPRIPFYFDFVQHNSHQSGRYWAKEFSPIEKILEFCEKYKEPISNYPNLINGIQANIWTETIHTGERLDFMTFPRIAALAEVAWTKNIAPEYKEFMQRMKPSFRLYQEKGVTYFNPDNPESTPEVIGVKK